MGLFSLVGRFTAKDSVQTRLHWRFLLASVCVPNLLSHHEIRCELPFGQRAQGKAAEAVLQSQLEAKGLGVKTQVRMHTFVSTGSRTDIRVVDMIDSSGVFHEVKSGKVSYNQTLVNQILKDIAIMKGNPECKGYVWHFFPGKNGKAMVDEKVLKMLQENGIDYAIHMESSETSDGETEGEGAETSKGGMKDAWTWRTTAAVLATVCCVSLGARLIYAGFSFTK